MRKQSTFQEDSGEIIKRVRAWVQDVTGKELAGDFRECLQDGIVLCELMAKLRPGSIQRVNKLTSPIAHLDNIKSFLQACRVHFLLNEAQIFDVTDLQDPEQRSGAFTSVGKRGWDAEKRMKNVCVTLYWIGRILAEERDFQGPLPDLSVFHPVLPGQSMSVPIPEEPEFSHSSVFRSPSPPSVPSRPDPKLVQLASDREGARGKVKVETPEEIMELLIIPINGSFGFHLLSKPLEGTNKFVSTVHSVLEDSAADRGGLMRGDQLLKVNGMDTSYFSHQQIVKLVKDSATTGTLGVKIRRTQLAINNADAEVVPGPTHFNSIPPPDTQQQVSTVDEVKPVEDPVPPRLVKSHPAHYIVDTEGPSRPKYRPVPPTPDEAIYVNQNNLEKEAAAARENRFSGKPRKSSPTKESPPRKQKGTLERESRVGTEGAREQTLGAKTPRSQMSLPQPPNKDPPQAPNSEPTRRKQFHTPESAGGSLRREGKGGCKVAVVESVDVSSPPARLENLSMEMSEESGDDVLHRHRVKELAANRVSMSDPFRGILPVSDGRSLLEEIFPQGEESSLHSILTEESPLKTPPQHRHHPTREYFSKILNPQISQPAEVPVPPPLQEPRLSLRERTVRQSPARSSGSSERHSAKLVDSLRSGGVSQITPVNHDVKKTEKRETKVENPNRNSNPLPLDTQQQLQQQQQQQPRRPYAHVTEGVISTQSLPQSYQPPPHNSINTSPTHLTSRHQTISHVSQQAAGNRGARGQIGRAKSFTGAHQPSRQTSDERNFSKLMSGTGSGRYRGEFPQGAQGAGPHPQESSWAQRGMVQRGQSMRQDTRQPIFLQRQAQSEAGGVPPYQSQSSYPPGLARGGYSSLPYPQGRVQTAFYPQQPQQQPQPQPVAPVEGFHKSKIFQINPNNASIPCTSCGHPLGVGAAAGVHGLKNIYHPGCYRCEVCGGQLLESSFILGGKLHCACCKDSSEGNLSTIC